MNELGRGQLGSEASMLSIVLFCSRDSKFGKLVQMDSLLKASKFKRYECSKILWYKSLMTVVSSSTFFKAKKSSNRLKRNIFWIRGPGGIFGSSVLPPLV